MKLLRMKCIKGPYLSKDSNPIVSRLGQEEYFVKLETDAEDNAYTSMNWHNNDLCKHWQAMLNSIDTTDEEVYFYVMADQPEPALGEQYTDGDGLVWERVE